MFHDSGLTANR